MTNGLLATESQLGRSGDHREISRASLIRGLASRGVPMTAQRRLLVSILQDSPRHLDAARLLQIAKERDPRLNRATVYRTIALLKRRGLIDELDLKHLDGEKHCYEAKTSRDHCHLACFECGAIIENFSAGAELYGGLGTVSGFGLKAASHYLGPTVQFNIPHGPSISFSPNFGLNDNSVGALYRIGVSYEFQQLFRRGRAK